MMSRACLYGDGLFETILIVNSQPRFWSTHWKRLSMGLDRLGFMPIDEQDVIDKIANVLSSQSLRSGIVRLSISREQSQRGYRVSPTAQTIIDIQCFSLASRWHGKQIAARWCKTQWAQQPLLAGIKHLNRLEQVLARNEWHDDAIEEGLVCDTTNHVISGTMSALLMRKGNQLFAADLSQTGVASIAREEALVALTAHHYQVHIKPLTKAEILSADELVMMNTIQGIAHVKQLDGHVYTEDSQLLPLLQTLFSTEV